jgi:hypothetical protein
MGVDSQTVDYGRTGRSAFASPSGNQARRVEVPLAHARSDVEKFLQTRLGPQARKNGIRSATA